MVPLLSINNLSIQFKSETELHTAVNNISFEIAAGELIAIVGESGSGKSITALSVLQLLPKQSTVSGEILFHQQETVDILKLSKKKINNIRGNKIAMIFQEPMTSLNPVFTCGYQVMESLQLHKQLSKKIARQETIKLFEKVQLPDPEILVDRYPHELSGGQKQRVMIAMAMSCNPSILIADEPTTALDVTVQKTILDLMLKLQTEHDMGIMFITHDLGVIAELADKVVVMYKGKIVEQGPVMEIFANPKHPYTKGLLACRPPLDRRLKWLPTVADFMGTDENGKIVELASSISEVLNKAVVTGEERTEAHKILYAKEPILTIKNLKTHFPIKSGFFGKTKDHVKAVDDVSFDVYPGETLGLVGESGCGKTTLGRTILRLIEPTAGDIIFKGKNLVQLNNEDMRAVRKDLQIIFQDPYSSLNPRITIGEAIMEPMQVHKILANDKERKGKVLELLKRVNMEEKHFYRYPHEFSGGQRQRICIARALALSPQFIICDESVSALDVSIQAQVLNLLNELKRDFHFTYIFISHDLSVVKFMSDRMVVMNKGKVEEMGDADAICDNPQTEYTQKLISAIPKGRLEDIQASIEAKKAMKVQTLSP